MASPVVIKVSGAQLDDTVFIAALAETIKMMDAPVAIVHGGGKAISQMQAVMGIEPQYVDGLRVTDAESMALVEMVLCGTVNTTITRILVLHGLDALGLNGADRGLIRADKFPHPSVDLGYVGIPTSVKGDWLKQLLADGMVPVIAPIGLGSGGPFNINADHVAGAVAKAIGASRVCFVSNVQGVLQEDVIIPTLTPSEIDFLIASDVITGGMIPKVRTAQDMVLAGVDEVVITDLDGMLTGGGTTFIPDSLYTQTSEE